MALSRNVKVIHVIYHYISIGTFSDLPLAVFVTQQPISSVQTHLLSKPPPYKNPNAVTDLHNTPKYGEQAMIQYYCDASISEMGKDRLCVISNFVDDTLNLVTL